MLISSTPGVLIFGHEDEPRRSRNPAPVAPGIPRPSGMEFSVRRARISGGAPPTSVHHGHGASRAVRASAGSACSRAGPTSEQKGKSSGAQGQSTQWAQRRPALLCRAALASSTKQGATTVSDCSSRLAAVGLRGVYRPCPRSQRRARPHHGPESQSAQPLYSGAPCQAPSRRRSRLAVTRTTQPPRPPLKTGNAWRSHF